MFTLEQLQKDLKKYQVEQEKIKEQYVRLDGVVSLLKMQINTLEIAIQDELSEREDEMPRKMKDKDAKKKPPVKKK